MTDAIRFFQEHAGYSYNPQTETQEEGRLRCARRLAEAEVWLAGQCGHTIEWVIDEDADREGIGHDGPLFGCVITCPQMGHAVASLWAIDLGKDGSLADAYTRVVVAELALELMPE